MLAKDYRWQTVVNFTIYALFYADKLGINSYNVEEKYATGTAMEKGFLRGEGMEDTGLPGDWVYRIISRVGNYSEIYYRSIVCDYVACDKPNEMEFDQLMQAIEDSRWPNKVFNPADNKPGMLVTPRF